ncbi:MAG: hypothetical protein AVDCRST_MAG33-637 [uncultured Thermomicrobiales bacterium]|uniref:Thioredoxin domain-containing protein n=1 Tax=uncultured Thermomicrobiales bacterium TaxID=1645740 RepID=A0A6J4UEF3_9BACT|nr:MAG: hypothetical protein AVDCRST_MAG33-637 [uncultured Thermomicrobiales bacterium]
MDTLLLLARLALAAVFIVAAIGKFLDVAGSQQAVRNFGLPGWFARPAGIGLPVVELTIGLFLLPVATAWAAGVAGGLLMLAFLGGIGYNLARGNRTDCHCFGQFHSEPIGVWTLVRNGIFAGVALFIAVAGQDGAGAPVLGWLDATGPGWLAMIAGSFAVGTVLSGAGLIVLLLRRNGQLLLRIDALEQRLSIGEATAGPMAIPSERERREKAHPAGLPVGVPAPPFQLSQAHGGVVSLGTLQAIGKPLVLVFSDPDCAPCHALLPEVAQWERQYANDLTVAVVARGDMAANRDSAAAHGPGLVVMDADQAVSRAYNLAGTPSAVLVLEDGTIGAPTAWGSTHIRELFQGIVSHRGASVA